VKCARSTANVNVNWPLQHYRTAARYLLRDKDEEAATGGTNWQQYLPPRFMKRIFFPELWTASREGRVGQELAHLPIERRESINEKNA
jgi:tryptophan 2,3-dioxygenase